MNRLLDIDSILDEVLDKRSLPLEGGRIILDEFPQKEVKMERLPSIPGLIPPEEPPPTAPTMISIMYENGSISYVNLEAIPVIQWTIDDRYMLMWPDTTSGILLKTLYIISKNSDPMTYQRIEEYLASKTG